MKIGVVGSGAMGSLFGARLVEAGVPMSCWSTPTARISRRCSEHGLVFDDSGETRQVPVKATADHAEAGPVDLIIFFVKHPHTRQAIRDAAADDA